MKTLDSFVEIKRTREKNTKRHNDVIQKLKSLNVLINRLNRKIKTTERNLDNLKEKIKDVRKERDELKEQMEIIIGVK
jgi:chromosome segregation ATPase